jgi:hypothetical protein
MANLAWHESERKDWAKLRTKYRAINEYYGSNAYAQLCERIRREANELYDSDENLSRKAHEYAYAMEYLKAVHDSNYGSDNIKAVVRDLLEPVKRDIAKTLAIRYGFVCMVSNRRMDYQEEIVKLHHPNATFHRAYLS